MATSNNYGEESASRMAQELPKAKKGEPKKTLDRISIEVIEKGYLVECSRSYEKTDGKSDSPSWLSPEKSAHTSIKDVMAFVKKELEAAGGKSDE